MLNREQIIEQINAYIHYYNQFDKPLEELSNQQYFSVVVLQDLLKQIEERDEVFDIRKNRLSAEVLSMFKRLE